MESATTRTPPQAARKPQSGGTSLSDRDMQTWAAIQHLIKVKRELELNIRALKATLPDKPPATARRPVYVINPKTGKREEVKCR